MESGAHISWDDFSRVDMRTGTILTAEVFPEAHKPAYKLEIDFGPQIGVLKSSAQITDLYQPDQLPGMQVIAVVNFPPKQIGPFISECLLLGAVNEKGEVTLLQTQQKTENGLRIS
jgi:tRNA-binding protein